jgi:electron transport complex protein RnfD
LSVLEYPAVELRTSPHIKSRLTTEAIMLNVVLALLPVCAFSVWAFGWSSLLLMLATTAVCVLTEHLACVLTRRPTTVGDWSAAVTGLLLGLTLPPGFPLWMAAVGAVVSILLGKTLFGGLGYNSFNPALVGRAFLQASFPVAITTWTPALAIDRFSPRGFVPSTFTIPFATPNWDAVKAYSNSVVDAWTGATPLMTMKFGEEGVQSIGVDALFTGVTSGSAGETSAMLILLGGLYLGARRMLDWRIPTAIGLTVVLMSGAFWLYDWTAYPSPMFMLLSGGLMLGATYMATDMVSSPTTPMGTWVYGILIGAITVIIRLWGGLPEGIMYAILLANALTPIINRYTQPRVYGTGRRAA